MSNISQLPTRAEFILAQLAEHLDGHGYFGLHAEPETLDESPTLYFEWATGDRCVFVNELGEIHDVDGPRDDGRPLTMRGFEWLPEPTDTGVMHGPWLGGARVTTPDGPGTALASEFGALDVVRVQLDSMADYHSGYCYRRCDLKILHSVGQRVRGTTRTV